MLNLNFVKIIRKKNKQHFNLKVNSKLKLFFDIKFNNLIITNLKLNILILILLFNKINLYVNLFKFNFKFSYDILKHKNFFIFLLQNKCIIDSKLNTNILFMFNRLKLVKNYKNIKNNILLRTTNKIINIYY